MEPNSLLFLYEMMLWVFDLGDQNLCIFKQLETYTVLGGQFGLLLHCKPFRRSSLKEPLGLQFTH